jgi:predicted nucleotidyltransferase
LQSPIVYRQEQGFKDGLWLLCQHYFSQKANIHHYLGIAQGALQSIINEDEIKIKKLFYVLRPLLAAKWCLERKSIAPMTIDPLMGLLPLDLQKKVGNLITLKAGAAESFVVRIDAVLRSYIDSEFESINEASKEAAKDDFDAEILDEFFVKTIRQYDY